MRGTPSRNEAAAGRSESQGTPAVASSREEMAAMHTTYMNSVLKQLCDQQVRFAPREKKLEQANRAERLLAELDKSTRTQNRTNELTMSMMQLMGRRALDKSNEDVLRIMDRVLDHSVAACVAVD